LGDWGIVRVCVFACLCVCAFGGVMVCDGVRIVVCVFMFALFLFILQFHA
jgi:hypothetical protein